MTRSSGPKSSKPNTRTAIIAAAAVAVACAIAAAAFLRPTSPAPVKSADVVVQSTTSVRDSGALEKLILPGFRAQHPEYTVKVLAVGTGEAMTNARAGQADALIMHAPPLEREFVADGFSLERSGRLIMWNDFVIVGPRSDPAQIKRSAAHDSAQAFEAIAVTGAKGMGHFVSRGDESGTHVKEREIWALTQVPHDDKGDPVSSPPARDRRSDDRSAKEETTKSPQWYHRAGVGQADLLRLTEQCPFAGGNCYTLTDRGTYAALVRNGAIKNLEILMESQLATAPGGKTLLINPYHAYSINPRKFADGQINSDGGRAFVSFLASEEFQRRLAGYPSAEQPAFFPAAEPQVKWSRRAPKQVREGQEFKLRFSVASSLPGASALDGLPVRLVSRDGSGATRTIAKGRLDSHGEGTLSAELADNAVLELRAPAFRDHKELDAPAGRVSVNAL